MWGIIIRAVTLLGIGAAVGSSVSNTPVIQSVPPPVVREAAQAISPFLVIAFALLVCAAGYFAWSLRRSR
jgi:TRAP-type C4-dicarboxylate transport system permease small subunit